MLIRLKQVNQLLPSLENVLTSFGHRSLDEDSQQPLLVDGTDIDPRKIDRHPYSLINRRSSNNL
jgi:hypothetical protein